MSVMKTWQEQARSQSGADTWDSFWQHLAAALAAENTETFRGVADVWEGAEEGLPERWHTRALEESGFVGVSVIWRRWGDAVVAARKP
jgi:hypothetical protein